MYNVAIICNTDLLRHYQKSYQSDFRYTEFEKRCLKKFASCFGFRKQDLAYDSDLFVTIFHNTPLTRSLVRNLSICGEVLLNLRFNQSGVGPLYEHIAKRILDLKYSGYDGLILIGLNNKCAPAIQEFHQRSPNTKILIVSADEHTDQLKRLADSRETVQADRRVIFADAFLVVEKVIENAIDYRHKLENIAAEPGSPEYYYRLARAKNRGRGNAGNEGEDVIATSPHWAYCYARDVVRGPWPEGERAIASDNDYAWKYGKYILKLEKNFTIWKHWDVETSIESSE